MIITNQLYVPSRYMVLNVNNPSMIVVTSVIPYIKERLNKIAARWPAKAVAQFFYFIEKIKKAVEILFVIRYCLVTTQKQLNTESPTAYEYNIIFMCHPQQEL